MKVSLNSNEMRTFCRAVGVLTKFGDVYFDWLQDGLSIKTVNSSRSAFATFIFSAQFFEKFECDFDDDVSLSRCKIPTKSCLTAFKPHGPLEKTIEKCRIHLDHQRSRLIVQYLCKYGIIKTFNLSIIECENLQAVYSIENSRNSFSLSSKLMHDVLLNFQSNHEEIALRTKDNGCEIRNYNAETDTNKSVTSQAMILEEEFTEYNAEDNLQITFLQKEMKAVLSFGELTDMSVKVHFDCPGKPLILVFSENDIYEVHFALATLGLPTGATQTTATQRSTQSIVRDFVSMSQNIDADGRDNPKKRSIRDIQMNSQKSNKKLSCEDTNIEPVTKKRHSEIFSLVECEDDKVGSTSAASSKLNPTFNLGSDDSDVDNCQSTPGFCLVSDSEDEC